MGQRDEHTFLQPLYSFMPKLTYIYGHFSTYIEIIQYLRLLSLQLSMEIKIFKF